jgi:hypothetical protein
LRQFYNLARKEIQVGCDGDMFDGEALFGVH